MKLTNPLRHPFRVPRVEKPRAEGRFFLPDGRRLGYAEFGDPSGPVVLWFHGSPGARRQFPLVGRRAARELGLRVILVERPGSGMSDPHAYDAIADWATDMAHVADALGAERLGVVGLSGGGPYALACGAVSPLAERVAAVAVLGGTVPSVGPDAVAGTVSDLARRFAPAVSALRGAMAATTTGLVTPLIPFAHYAIQGVAGLMPEGDQVVFADPEIEGMFIDDNLVCMKGGFQAIYGDARLFGRDWGFRFADVQVPVRWWHGDSDPIVSLPAAEEAVSRLPGGELVLLPGTSHLGGFAQADEVLKFVRAQLDGAPESVVPDVDSL
ncbi:alpha/beta hydrolase [Mycobacterium intermedium]|uniref:Alpha/beta hydrolase n=1 Tax=Mycobacterium intermedium TaxID=28445 RepID=A0A1E3SAQ3_MYCIE|nr:alpha/beta hydrolase [Mycobacterium intermedium]MCV6967746.1 alpha/beta hydrolase [Mycobacterium intermedium]ODQ99131.1 alpha/beta hydrolase [Mycobacterium intermedium]OPE50563.1 alpha/beta hydrolase [Mycobacterium intermedium]ORB05509.1 alpha/beta hydrolase [Mycobacterium intermedium]